jgi:hypothetical protein
MSGQPDHATIAAATPLGPARTAPHYRFFAVRDAFPGLLPVETGGRSIDHLAPGEAVVDITDLGGWRVCRAFLAANARIDEVLRR